MSHRFGLVPRDSRTVLRGTRVLMFVGLCLVGLLATGCSTRAYDELASGDCVEANERQMLAGLFDIIDCQEYQATNPEHWKIQAVGDFDDVRAACPSVFQGIVIKDDKDYAVCFGK